MNRKENDFMLNFMQFIIDFLQTRTENNIIYDCIEIILNTKQMKEYNKRRRK